MAGDRRLDSLHNSDLALELGVGQVHLTHAAGAERADDLVGAERSSGLQLHGMARFQSLELSPRFRGNVQVYAWVQSLDDAPTAPPRGYIPANRVEARRRQGCPQLK